jgi:hypothetical protein
MLQEISKVKDKQPIMLSYITLDIVNAPSTFLN